MLVYTCLHKRRAWHGKKNPQFFFLLALCVHGRDQHWSIAFGALSIPSVLRLTCGLHWWSRPARVCCVSRSALLILPSCRLHVHVSNSIPNAGCACFMCIFFVHTHFLLVFAFFLPGLPTSDPPAPLDPPLPSESRSCLSWLRCLRFPNKKNVHRTVFN